MDWSQSNLRAAEALPRKDGRRLLVGGKTVRERKRVWIGVGSTDFRHVDFRFTGFCDFVSQHSNWCRRPRCVPWRASRSSRMPCVTWPTNAGGSGTKARLPCLPGTGRCRQTRHSLPATATARGPTSNRLQFCCPNNELDTTKSWLLVRSWKQLIDLDFFFQKTTALSSTKITQHLIDLYVPQQWTAADTLTSYDQKSRVLLLVNL